jgi:hypothetical protein
MHTAVQVEAPWRLLFPRSDSLQTGPFVFPHEKIDWKLKGDIFAGGTDLKFRLRRIPVNVFVLFRGLSIAFEGSTHDSRRSR